MLSETVYQALTYQLNHELTNSLLYRQFASLCEYQGLSGSSNWFLKQAEEEYTHFNKIYQYLVDQGHMVDIIPTPDLKAYKLSLEELFRRTLEREQQTTQYLKDVMSIAKQSFDDQTVFLMYEFLKEQIEEEKVAIDIFQRIQISMNNLLIIDQELGKR